MALDECSLLSMLVSWSIISNTPPLSPAARRGRYEYWKQTATTYVADRVDIPFQFLHHRRARAWKLVRLLRPWLLKWDIDKKRGKQCELDVWDREVISAVTDGGRRLQRAPTMQDDGYMTVPLRIVFRCGRGGVWFEDARLFGFRTSRFASLSTRIEVTCAYIPATNLETKSSDGMGLESSDNFPQSALENDIDGIECIFVLSLYINMFRIHSQSILAISSSISALLLHLEPDSKEDS
jgi:hypothetical protein